MSLSHRFTRQKLFVRALMGAALARPVSVLCTLIQTPIALAALDDEGFGFWLALTAVLNTLAIADLGISYAMQNRVSFFLGTEDLAAAGNTFFQTVRWLVLAGGAIFFLLLPVVLFVDWNAVFHLAHPATREQSRWCLLITLAAVAVSLPLNSGQRLASGLQLSWLGSLTVVVASLFTLLLILVASYGHFPLSAFIGLTMLPSLACNAVLIGILCRKNGWRWSFLWTTKVDAAERRSLLRSGGLFFLPQLGATLIFTAPMIIVAAVLGAAAATPFGLASRVTSLLLQLAGMLLMPLWPAYAEARARGDFEWIRHTHRRAFWLTLGLAGAGSLVLAVSGVWLIRLWIGSDNNLPSQMLMNLLCLWVFLNCMGAQHACLFNGLGELRGQATYGFLASIVSVSLIPVLIPSFGLAGAGMALLLGYALINCPGFIVERILLFRKIPKINLTPDADRIRASHPNSSFT